MPKRNREAEDTDRPPKRPKPAHAPPAPIEEIHFARQLHQLLHFRQDGILQLRNGIASFKAFLESILYHKEEDNRARLVSILREFLETQKPADPKNTERPFLGELWQAWSFAVQNNNDYLTSSVTSVLTLLLRTLSTLIDLRDHGILLCRTALQHQHLRLIKRGLDAPKHKEFLVSPCLRLLTEVTSFDGGVLAREVYKRREQTFDVNSLRRNLGLTKTSATDEEELRRKPSVRTQTVRYILAHLRYQSEGAKVDILKQRPICGALFQYLRDDSAHLIVELLRTVEQSVLKDNELPRSSKAALLTDRNLERVTELASRVDVTEIVSQTAFAWLKAVVTVPSYGVLRASAWYPPGSTKYERSYETHGAIDLGLDSLDFYDRSESFQVRNTTLLTWIQALRPHVDPKERKLVLACFEAAPELVHAYFTAKNTQLDPKLSNTWVGYASFLFEVVRLSVPERLGHVEGSDTRYAQLPPQTNILMDSILPAPLTQKVLTRCLNQSNELITFFAVRLLVLAFQKLATVLRQINDVTAIIDRPDLWHEARDRLLIRFDEQCPAMKDVVHAFRQIQDNEEHTMQREAFARLLQLYCEVRPLQALEEAFDVSGALTAALLRSEQQDTDSDDDVQRTDLRSLELEHLLVIATKSSGVNWFTKPGPLKFSPVVSLLKLHSKQYKNKSIRNILGSVLYEHDILKRLRELDEDGATPLDALIASLLAEERDTEPWAFLDDCLTRASRKPVKYLDDLDVISTRVGAGAGSGALPGLLAAVLAEQVPFVLARPASKERTIIVAWVERFLKSLLWTDRSNAVYDHIVQDIASKSGWQVDNESGDVTLLVQTVRLSDVKGGTPTSDALPEASAKTLPFAAPPAEPDDHPELLRWLKKDLDTAIDEGDIDALMLCLCSRHKQIRRQAHAQLNTLRRELDTSGIEVKDQVSILVGELIESYEQYLLQTDEALPYLVGTFAAKALHVLTEPTHFMYSRVNCYMMKDPCWRIAKLPSYWVQAAVLGVPEEDDAYWKETQWVLEWLVDGLRTTADLQILRRCGIFQRLMALYNSPAASERLVKLRVLDLLYRTTCIEGGSDTMVTRTGVLSWLRMHGDDSFAEAMRTRILETCNKTRIGEWSGTDVASM